MRVCIMTEITTGDVFIHDNFLLCYVDTINWSDIISVKAKYSSSNVSPSIKKTCKSFMCHDNCMCDGLYDVEFLMNSGVGRLDALDDLL